MPVTAGGSGFEFEPALGNAVVFARHFLFILAKTGGSDRSQLMREHVPDLVAALQCPQVPGEGHQIPPVAIGLKQVHDGVDITFFQGLPEL